MKVSTSKAPVSRLLLATGTISMIFLLLTAACARGEAIDDAAAPLVSAAEDVVSTEQAPAPVPPPAEAPAETPESGSATDVVGAVVEAAGKAVESDAVASPVAAATETVREATPETVREAAGEVGRVAAKTVAAASGQAQQVSQLSEEAGGKVAAAAGLGNPPRAEKLLQPAATAPVGALSHPGGSPVSEIPAFRGEAPSTDGAPQPPQPVVVSVGPRLHPSGESSLPVGDRGFAGAELSWLGSPSMTQSTPTGDTTGARSNDRAPLDVPMPAPLSSGAAAGSAGSSFAPLVALLALLALVVPATLRRLREVPASWSPIPFVCALERPG